MASTGNTHVAAPTPNQDDEEVDLKRRISQAFDEGHDADIPSSLGYVVTEDGQRKRRRSIAEQTSRRQSHATDRDVEKGAAVADSDEAPVDKNPPAETDVNIVWWDGPDDPENPYNWPRWRTLLNCTLISALCFITPLASSIFAPGVPQLMEEFQNDSLVIASFVVTVYVLGFAAGPLLFAPLSEIYGRVIIYHICNVGFIAFLIGCALAPNINALIVFRFFSGVFGSSPVTNGGGSIADMVVQERRGAAMALYTLGPLMGPIIGPVAGGFLAAAKGWRWVFWLLVILAGALSAVFVICAKETYAPVILARRTERRRKETGNKLLRSKLDVGLSKVDYFKRSIVRPIRMLIFGPVVWITSLYLAVIYGYLYLMFTSITEVFTQYYGFSTSLVGLVFLGLGVGSLIGVAIFSLTSDKYVKKKAAQADAAAAEAGDVKEGMKPEYRLPTLPLGSILVTIGLFIYGWTAEYRIHWIVPIIGMTVVGVGNLIVFMAIQLYLVDAFTIYAASALAANTVVRSVVGAVLPLAGLSMYANLGIGWGNSVLGFIAVALTPIAFLIIKYGEYLRKRFEIKNL